VEVLLNADPLNPDSDHDGISDAQDDNVSLILGFSFDAYELRLLFLFQLGLAIIGTMIFT